jgi:hypothetical protein
VNADNGLLVLSVSASMNVDQQVALAACQDDLVVLLLDIANPRKGEHLGLHLAIAMEIERYLVFAYRIGAPAFYRREWHGNPRLCQGDPAGGFSSRLFLFATLLQSGSALLQELQRLR